MALAWADYQIPSNYKWVALSTAGIALECFFLGIIYINRIRGKIFTQEFMDKNFGQVSNNAFGVPPSKTGYPDSGNGLHANKLPFSDWLDFNTAMRGHLNFVEYLPAMLILTLICGFFWPATTAWLGLGLFVSRLFYIIGYAFAPALRQFGFAPMVLILLTETVLILIGLWSLFFKSN